ncbi:MAG: helix-turn-helix transcriptional regulator [Cyanobacteria bacterium P01_F01_bin.150]
MKIELSFTELQEAIADFQRQFTNQLHSDLQSETGEALLIVPSWMGNGYIRGVRLRDGLDLSMQEYVLKNDLVLSGQNVSIQESYACFAFCLSGQFKSTFPGFKSSISMRTKDASFYTVPYAAGTLELKAEERIHLVEIAVRPSLLLNLIGDELIKLPENLRKAVQSEASHPSIHLCNISEEISQVLQKVISCPYRGKIRKVYLEGKVLELIALYFSQFCPPGEIVPSIVSKRQQDIDQIEQLYKGREILKQNLVTPPSVEDLSKQLGINERSLQEGFRELFGTTVFGVLHNDRMEHARQLLETQEMNIGAIANMVGISHRGYFAKAFKRKFGITPREYSKRNLNSKNSA